MVISEVGATGQEHSNNNSGSLLTGPRLLFVVISSKILKDVLTIWGADRGGHRLSAGAGGPRRGWRGAPGVPRGSASWLRPGRSGGDGGVQPGGQVATPEPCGRLRGVLWQLEGLAIRPSGRCLRPHPGVDVRAPARPWGAAGARVGRGLRVQGTFVTLVADKAAFCLPGSSHGGDLACKEVRLAAQGRSGSPRGGLLLPGWKRTLRPGLCACVLSGARARS